MPKAEPEMLTRTLFRIVSAAKPTVDDFRPSGRVAPNQKEDTQRLRDGVSMLKTLAQARRRARALAMGDYIAEVELPMTIRAERTLSRGHHTVWAAPDVLLGLVTRVYPVKYSDAEKSDESTDVRTLGSEHT